VFRGKLWVILTLNNWMAFQLIRFLNK